MSRLLERLRNCRRGATAVEYGFILALICVAIIAIVSEIGGRTLAMWTNISVRFPTVQG